MAPPRRTSGKNKPKKAKNNAERMAALYVQARTTLVRAGLALHDHVGSSLSAAGVQLQLLRMDVPAAGVRVDETLQILEETLNRVRDLSTALCPSPAHRGSLRHALQRLADQPESNGCLVSVEYSATPLLPPEIAIAIYEAACSCVAQALRRGAARVNITVRGNGPLVARISDDGRKSGRARALSAIGILAREQGLGFECKRGKGTIVSIRYAIRRTSRG